MGEGALFRVIDVYLSDAAFAPLLQSSRVLDEEVVEEEGLAFVDETAQEQMRALGLPTRFSSVPRKRVSRRLRRSGRSHQVTCSLDEQCSLKLSDGINQAWAAQHDGNKDSRTPKKEANFGEGAFWNDHQGSKSVCLSIRDDVTEASVSGAGAIDGCGRLALISGATADVSTSHELGNLHETRGNLAHERVGVLDGGGPFDKKEENSGLLNMSNGHSVDVYCKRKVSSHHFTEDAISGSSSNHLEGTDSVELTSGIDDHGANNEEASVLSFEAMDGALSLSCGMVARKAINEIGIASNSMQPHAKEGERISIKISATKGVSIAEAMLVPTDGALLSEEPFVLFSSRAAAQCEQLTTLSGSNQKAVSEGSIGSCDARANDILVKGVEQDLLIEEGGSHIKSPEVLSWSACWDDHYGRYYFYNIETLESTWDPPQGFECYVSLSAVEGNNKAFQDGLVNAISNDEELAVEVSEKERALSEDGFKSDTSLHGPLVPEVEALPILSTVKEALKSSGNPLGNLQSNFLHGTDGSLPEKEGTIEGPEVVLESSTCHVNAHSANSSVVQEDAATFKVLGPTRRAKLEARCLARLENHGLDIFAAMGDHSHTIFKYWAQRFHLFSKYDLGVKLDEEGWFSVTPEAIAKHQAARCRHGVVVDAFAGVGGNAIQFALAGHYVVAIDNDPKKIEYAYHNAMIYGVLDRIDFVLGDFYVVAPQLRADVVFLSPPWGGPDYLSVEVYDILTMLQPKDGISLFKVAQTVASNVMFFLPRNVDMNQLAELSNMLSSPCSCEIERNYLNGKLKAVTAYYGEFARTEQRDAVEASAAGGRWKGLRRASLSL